MGAPGPCLLPTVPTQQGLAVTGTQGNLTVGIHPLCRLWGKEAESTPPCLLQAACPGGEWRVCFLTEPEAPSPVGGPLSRCVWAEGHDGAVGWEFDAFLGFPPLLCSYEAPNVMQPILKWGFHVSTRLLHGFGHEVERHVLISGPGKAYLEG